jgi:hypothetical protein
MKNPKPKFPSRVCKGDRFLRDCPGLPKVLEMWSSMSSSPAGHVGDTPSTSDVKVGKKNRTVKFPCMLCEGDHHSHLFPRMDELLIFWKSFNFQLVIVRSLPTCC